MSHCILLIQSTNNSKCYHEYANPSQAMDGLCKLFETHLKLQNPGSRNITYDVKDLYGYIDTLPDLGILVFDTSINGYSPFDKNWIKQKVLAHLKKLAQQH